MDPPSIDDLEDFVREHCHEPWRSIRDGIKKEYDVPKSSNWIAPRKKAALIAESLAEETEEPLEAEIPEEESPEEPAETEEDEKIIEMNLQIKQMNKKIEFEQTQKKLTLAQAERTTVEDLLEDVDELELLREEDATFTVILKAKLEELMSQHRNYFPSATCPRCGGAFFWRSDKNLLKCFICEKDYKLPAQ